MDFTAAVFGSKPEKITRPIYVDGDRPERTVTGADYVSLVKRAAVGLWHAGLKDQDCVGVLSGNDLYYYVFGDAVVAAGGVFCPLQTSTNQHEIQHQLKVTEVKLLFVSPILLDLALEAAKAIGLPTSQVFVFDPPGSESPLASQPRFSALVQRDEQEWQNPNKGKDPTTRLALRVLSSGTTGVPKAVNISHKASIARTIRPEQAAPPCPANISRKYLIYTPAYHVSSLMAGNRAPFGPVPFYICREKRLSDIPALIDIIKTQKITDSTIPPRYLDAILTAITTGTVQKEDLSSLINVYCGGCAINHDVVRAWRDLFPHHNIMLSYGSTEISIITKATNSSIDSHNVGAPFSDVELRIIDPESLQEVPPGETGEICARGAQNYIGYHNNLFATKSSTLPDPEGDFFRTGDRGYWMKEHGQLAVTGRYKEIFKVGGKQISPDEVENVICQHSGIEDAAVTSTVARDNQSDQELVAYVVRKDSIDGSNVTAQEVVDKVGERLDGFKAPTGGVVFTDWIPRNALLKIVRRQLGDMPVREGSREYLDIPA